MSVTLYQVYCTNLSHDVDDSHWQTIQSVGEPSSPECPVHGATDIQPGSLQDLTTYIDSQGAIQISANVGNVKLQNTTIDSTKLTTTNVQYYGMENPPTPPSGTQAFFIDPTDKQIKLKDALGNLTYLTHYKISTPQICVAADGSQQFTTIAAAVAWATTKFPAGAEIAVLPGTYVENNPIHIPANMGIMGKGPTSAVTVVAANSNQHVFTTVPSTEFEGLTIAGAYGTGCAGIYFNGTGVVGRTRFEALKITNCDIGVIAYGKPGILICSQNLNIKAHPTRMTTGYLCDGGDLKMFQCGGAGLTTSFMLPNVVIVQNGGLLYTISSIFQNYITGISVYDSATLVCQDTSLINGTTGMFIASDATASQIYLDGLVNEQNTTWDLNIQPTSVSHLDATGCRMRTEYINNPNNIHALMTYTSSSVNSRGQVVLGDLQIGNYFTPTRSIFGYGDRYINTMVVYSHDGTSFTNCTAAFQSESMPSQNLFSDIVVGNYAYIGSNYAYSGLYVDTVTSLSNADSAKLQFEYWNSNTNAWTSFKIMVSSSIAPYTSFSNLAFSQNISTDIDFGKMDNWGLTTVNGINKYWIRIAIVSDLSDNVELQRVMVYPSCLTIQKDGFTSYYGSSRPIESLRWNLSNFKMSTTNVPAQTIYLSDNLSVAMTNNVFDPDIETKIGMNTFLPQNIDTSFPIKIVLSFIQHDTATGDVVWNIRTGYNNNTDSIYIDDTSAPTTFVNEVLTSITHTVSSVANVQQNTIVYIPVDGFNARRHNQVNDTLWIDISRNGADVNDTYTNDIVLCQLSGYYVKWCEGDHLENY